jgi:hypothetical protein
MIEDKFLFLFLGQSCKNYINFYYDLSINILLILLSLNNGIKSFGYL